ncbi:putative sugar transporter STL1 [Hyaloscypha variabilis]
MAIGTLQGRALYKVMSTFCALAFCLYGYDAGVLGGVQSTKPFLDAIENPKGTYIIPLVASSYVLAATVTTLVVMWIGLRLGRRRCIIIGDIFVIVGTAVQASSFSVAQIIVARVICGTGIDFISCTVPTYMAEMSIESKERGPEVAKQCAWLISGIALAYWLDFGFTRMDSQVSWRFPIAFQAAFAGTSLALMLLLPDTPRWYYAKARNTEGDGVLSRLHNKPIDHPDEEEMNRFRITSLIWDTTDLRAGRRIRIAFCLLAIQQMMGINVMVYYSTKIFADMGLSDFLSQILAAVMNTVYAAGCWVLPFTIEAFGRRHIMIGSAIGCTVTMLIFFIMIALPHPTDATQWIAVVFVIFFNFFIGYGWVGVALIAPLKYRHIGNASSAFGEWLFSFITVFAGGIAITNIGWKIWIWQLLSCICAIIFPFFMCPETGGKTLEEIDFIFVKGGDGRDLSSGVTSGKEEMEVSQEEKV